MDEIVNRVAKSPLVTIDMEELLDFPEIVEFDMKDHLFQGLILKEKDFRSFIAENDWAAYKGKAVAIFCSSDAIVPTWAFMLVANRLQPYAKEVFSGDSQAFIQAKYEKVIESMDATEYADKMVVVKGCFNKPVPMGAYIAITTKLSPIVKSLMFGEACSAVPIYKRKKEK